MKKAPARMEKEDADNIRRVEEKLEETRALLEEINRTTLVNLEKITENIEEVLDALRVESAKVRSTSYRPSLLQELSDNDHRLRKTIKVLIETGIATAEEVSEKTGRSRSLESSYLNQLTTLGYVEKSKKGKTVYYKIKFDKRPASVD